MGRPLWGSCGMTMLHRAQFVILAGRVSAAWPHGRAASGVEHGRPPACCQGLFRQGRSAVPRRQAGRPTRARLGRVAADQPLRIFPMAAAFFFSVAFALTVGCAAPPDPVAVARLTVNRASVPLGAPVDVTVQFDVAPNLEPLNEDYRVVLHAFDDNEIFLWSTEHDPPVPTSEWQPGWSIRYTQRVRIPRYPYVGPAVIAISLHAPDSGANLALAGDELDEFAYRVATLTFEPQPESSFISYDEGWHPLEFAAFGQITWRWSTERAVISFRNPYRPARLLLDVQGRPGLFDRPQSLSLVVNDRTIHEVTLDTNEIVHLDYELTEADLGDYDIVNLELLVDRTFVPAKVDDGYDTRELGVRVSGAYVEPLTAR